MPEESILDGKTWGTRLKTHVLEVKSQDGCSRAEESVLQNQGVEVAEDEAMQGPVHTLRSWSSAAKQQDAATGLQAGRVNPPGLTTTRLSQ